MIIFYVKILWIILKRIRIIRQEVFFIQIIVTSSVYLSYNDRQLLIDHNSNFTCVICPFLMKSAVQNCNNDEKILEKE